CSRPRSGRARSSTRTSRSSTPSPVPSSSASHSTARRSRASSVPGPSRKLRPRRSVGRPDLSPGRAALGGVSVGDGLPVVAVGVVNLSPESFHAGSVYTRDDDLLGAALGMVEAGAALIDVGARSTAPYLDAALDEAEERDRLVRAVELLARKLPVPISADTARPAPARAALEAGARVINDVSGLRDPAVAALVAKHHASVILMASLDRGGPGGPVAGSSRPVPSASDAEVTAPGWRGAATGQADAARVVERPRPGPPADPVEHGMRLLPPAPRGAARRVARGDGDRRQERGGGDPHPRPGGDARRHPRRGAPRAGGGAVSDPLAAFRWRDALDILLVAIVIYRVFVMFRGTRAVQMMIGLGALAAASLLARQLELYSTVWLLDNFWSFWVIALVVLFQPELRRVLASLGQGRVGQALLGASREERAQVTDEIANAVESLSGRRIGALLVIERATGLRQYAE